MGLRQLKRIRAVVSLIFVLLTALLFLDFRHWFAPAVGDAVLYLQFVPSLLKFTYGAALGAGGCILVLLLTLCVGRIYCSAICPLGTMQDIAGYVSRRQRGRFSHQYRPPHTILRVAVLILTVLLLLVGSNLLLNLLDPFSIFGRIFANIFRPLGIVVNNSGAAVLEKFAIYAFPREHWATMAPVSLVVAAGMLLFVVVMAAKYGRLYCNTICPVGTLLGLVARFSFLRLHLDEGSCTSCGRCVAACKAGCIDLAAKTVDMSRCVSCYNCLAACNVGGVGFVPARGFKAQAGESDNDNERREFLLNSGAVFVTFLGMPLRMSFAGETARQIIGAQPTTIPVIRSSPVSPPGSRSVEHFTQTCTACHLCVSSCPEQILLPSFLEYGLSGFMQPRMFFQTGHCNYECTICGDVCPADAILPLTVEQKKKTQIGIAEFIQENCVVVTDNTACGACSEHCPTKAVNMVPYLNISANSQEKNLTIPEVSPELCVGCGGCEHACPTRPYKAIFVKGNPVHQLARKPVVQQVEHKVDYQEDFPF